LLSEGRLHDNRSPPQRHRFRQRGSDPCHRRPCRQGMRNHRRGNRQVAGTLPLTAPGTGTEARPSLSLENATRRQHCNSRSILEDSPLPSYRQAAVHDLGVGREGVGGVVPATGRHPRRRHRRVAAQLRSGVSASPSPPAPRPVASRLPTSFRFCARARLRLLSATASFGAPLAHGLPIRGHRSGGGRVADRRLSVADRSKADRQRIPKRTGSRMGKRIANRPFPALARGPW
jgi:hypothetical protein